MISSLGPVGILLKKFCCLMGSKTVRQKKCIILEHIIIDMQIIKTTNC